MNSSDTLATYTSSTYYSIELLYAQTRCRISILILKLKQQNTAMPIHLQVKFVHTSHETWSSRGGWSIYNGFIDTANVQEEKNYSGRTLSHSEWDE